MVWRRLYVATLVGEGGGGGGSTWVEAGLRVTRSVAVDLCSSYKDGLNPDQLGDGEWNAEAQVLSTIQFHLTSINPACVSQKPSMATREGEE